MNELVFLFNFHSNARYPFKWFIITGNYYVIAGGLKLF